MNDQLDKDLKNRIREVFDNFEDPTADEGWLLLRERFPAEEKKRPVAWLWWSGMAAALLLFLGIGFWVLDKKPQQTNVTANNTVKQQQTITADTNTLPAQKPSAIIKSTPVDALPSTQPAIAKTRPAAPGKNLVINNPVSHVQQNNIAANNTPANNTPAGVNPATNNNAKVNAPANNNQQANPVYAAAVKPALQQPAGKAIINTPVTKGTDSTQTLVQTPQYAVTKAAPQNSTAVAAASATKTNTIAPPVKKQAPANSMEAMFAAEANQPKKVIKDDDNEKKVRFSVYAATFFNYAKGSTNQVNAGAGFTSDIKLSKNIKFSTGLALAQNTLSYSGSLPPNTSNRLMADAAITTPQKTETFAANAAFPVYKNYNANLVGLDIPLNIKYEFSPNRSDAYISAGLSSGTFINEAYTTSYGLPDKSLAAGLSQQTTDDVTRKSFDGFYFAKTLNVSFGIGTALGKSNRLIIEPFLKYPLSGLGAEQIKFGAGGLNLKLNFTTGKK